MIIIKKALYHDINIKSELESLLSSGQTQILINNSIVGDPCPGVLKSLVITYDFAGIEYTRTIQEGDILTFEPFKGDKLGLLYSITSTNPKILEASLKSINKCNIDTISSSWAAFPLWEFPVGEPSTLHQLKSKYESDGNISTTINILQCLYTARSRNVSYNYVSFLDSSTLYHSSHFQYPLGDILINTNIVSLSPSGYSPITISSSFSQMTMKFNEAIIFFENALLSSIKEDFAGIKTPDSSYTTKYESIIPNAIITNSNAIGSPIHSYWGVSNRYV